MIYTVDKDSLASFIVEISNRIVHEQKVQIQLGPIDRYIDSREYIEGRNNTKLPASSFISGLKKQYAYGNA